MQRQLAEITRRREMYMHGIPPIDVARRTVILVDDGIATGGTVRAALKGLRKLGPARLILAVPVGPPDMLAKLGQECDELVCLAEPAPFFAVGADRKSVVSGKSVSVRVDLGGRRIIKKKKRHIDGCGKKS